MLGSLFHQRHKVASTNNLLSVFLQKPEKINKKHPKCQRNWLDFESILRLL